MRIFLAIVFVLAVVGALAAVKAKQIGSLIAMGKEMEKAGAPPEPVSAAKAQEQSWESTLSAIGSVVANKGVAVSNDAPGVVSRIHFESGALVRQGQPLVELETSVERAQLASAKVRRELAETTVKRTRALFQTGAVSQAQIDADEATLKTASTDYEALLAQIERKTTRAPFAGRIGLRAINLGQYLAPGTTIALLEAVDSVYVDFSLPQQRLPDVKVGMPVRVALQGDAGAPLEGAVAAVEPTVDAVTRTLKVRATVPNKEERVRPGMFVTVSLVLPERAAQIIVPQTAVVHASYGDSVFVVEGAPAGPDGKPRKIARQQFVKLGEARGDFVAVVDGVKAGEELVTAGAFKLRNKAPIVLVDAVGLSPSLAPQPVER